MGSSLWRVLYFIDVIILIAVIVIIIYYYYLFFLQNDWVNIFITSGPLVTDGLIRIGVHRAWWSTFTAEPLGEWDIDVAIMMNDSSTEAQHTTIETALNELVYSGFLVD
jgi:hypothetical protein